MDRMKKFGKYILMIIGMYILTAILIFVGFNLNYKSISLVGDLPVQITIEKAEATSKTGRIYGYVSNSESNNVNDKYIKIEIYNSNNENIQTQYLKINDVDFKYKKMFRATFKVEDAKSYRINIVDKNQ